MVHIDSLKGKKEMERQKSWVEAICLSTVARRRTWPVIVYGVKTENYPLDAWKKHAKSIQKENAKLSPDLQIQGMRWLKRINRGEYGSLMIKIESIE
jgi:hypothetical protein